MECDDYSDDEIQEILSLNTVAVVGMSRHPNKAAHFVPKYLADNDFNVIPVNPNTKKIMGIKSYEAVSKIKESIDIVNIFRPSDQVLPVVVEAIKKNPKVIWLQEGIHNPEAEEMARDKGIKVVFNRCMLVEHRRLS